MRPNHRRWLRLSVALVVLAGALVFVARALQKKTESAQPASAQAVPVVTAMAAKGDQPVYLSGLGTVTALNTVTLRTRVDGELLRILVREGQMVSAGDL